MRFSLICNCYCNCNNSRCCERLRAVFKKVELENIQPSAFLMHSCATAAWQTHRPRNNETMRARMLSSIVHYNDLQASCASATVHLIVIFLAAHHTTQYIYRSMFTIRPILPFRVDFTHIVVGFAPRALLL